MTQPRPSTPASPHALRHTPAVRVSSEALVTFSHLDAAPDRPLVVQPALADVNVVSWAERHRTDLQARLRADGAVLFRGFGIGSLDAFRQLVRAVSPDVVAYGERSSPRTQVTEGIYTSTDHPPDQPIVLHNEQSYTLNWPMKIWFFCQTPAAEGGCTPIADSRRIYARLPAHVRDAFDERGVAYVRNYGRGLGLTWPEVFQTHDKAAVEEHCRRAGILVEWIGGDGLRTRQVRPAIRRHPDTGELVWFNHGFFFNVASLTPAARDALLAVVAEEDLPFHTTFGDGTRIGDDMLDALRAAYDAETIRFPWQQGDVLLLDNMLVAHGRDPFVGPRSVLVAMAEPFDPHLEAA